MHLGRTPALSPLMRASFRHVLSSEERGRVLLAWLSDIRRRLFHNERVRNHEIRFLKVVSEEILQTPGILEGPVREQAVKLSCAAAVHSMNEELVDLLIAVPEAERNERFLEAAVEVASYNPTVHRTLIEYFPELGGKVDPS